MRNTREEARKILREAIDSAQPGRYQATIQAAKVRKENDRPVNQRNLKQAKDELSFYEHLEDVIEGKPLREEYDERVTAILDGSVKDAEAVTERLTHQK